jgi:phosphotransferase system enzyme I (PtsI)
MAERRHAGRVAAPGLARGPLIRLPTAALDAPDDTAAGDPAAERVRLQEAIAVARADLEALMAGSADEMAGEILSFQLEMLDDPALAEAAFEAIAEGVAAGTAWRSALAMQIAVFRADGDGYFQARAADLEDLRDRVRLALDGGGVESVPLPEGAIVFARDLTPSRFLAFDWTGLGGAALAEGSAASHVAMLARARGVPLLVGLGEVEGEAGEAVLDAFDGQLVLEPEPLTAAAYAAQLEAARAEATAAAVLLFRPAATAQGQPVGRATGSGCCAPSSSS